MTASYLLISGVHDAPAHELHLPAEVYAALPVDPLSENVVVVRTVMVHVPLAFVLPFTPVIVAMAPVARPCAAVVVMTMGDAFVAPEMLPFALSATGV